MKPFRPFVAAVVCLLLTTAAAAFNGHQVAEGPIVLTIGPVETISATEVPREFVVTVENKGNRPLLVRLELKGLVDEFRPAGPATRSLAVDAGKRESTSFRIIAGQGACSALYPVHVYASFDEDGKTAIAHAVQVFETAFAEPLPEAATPRTNLRSVPVAGELPVVEVPTRGAAPLVPLDEYRVTWAYFDTPAVRLPAGWKGSDPVSKASFHKTQVARGEVKPALVMHPPYHDGKGSIFAEYLLKLPETTPLQLMFFNAIRDNAPTEPPSDGVTFRVWADDQKLFEKHTDAKVWTPGEVDLSSFAGRRVLLRLESHPGPRENTVCDSSFWGDVAVIAGAPPLIASDERRQELLEKARAAVSSGRESGENIFVFPLGAGCRAAVAVGPNGLADGAITFGTADRVVGFEGFETSILASQVGDWPSAVMTDSVETAQDDSGQLTLVQRLSMGSETFDLTATVWRDGPGLRLKLACPKLITNLALGPADQTADRVYYGHGYCIEKPEAFSASGGGHNLSSSHVSFEFAGGMSLLTACDSSPDRLKVDPQRRIYALQAHHDTTFMFVPGVAGAMDCAVRYRPLFDKRPAGAVQRKAGRFVFDLWGGRYADNAANLKKAFQYGLTDSMVILHNWQRWGYDYRLPDIYPPNPQLGTLEDMQALARLCAEHDVPFGLHDNYIDFYPDAEDYSYDRIVFSESGHPQKAWINTGRDAQSYRWRPDCIQPFVERNVRLIKPNMHPTAYFLDVFTSSDGFDFFDRSGTFHGKPECRRCWGEAFSFIRDYLGGDAPTVSEAGSDHLIGYLDGADCQFLQIGPKPQRFHITLDCKDWQRVPWFDAVNHARFILHGVGYSTRYQGGRSRELGGIESDDYLTAEVLTGHALMIDAGGMVRGAVRKYWLAQPLARHVALDEITGFEFAHGDIHRQVVTWKGGVKVYVNRGPSDWEIAGRRLPPFGYFAVAGQIESSIERIEGAVVEQSRGPGWFYVNGRGFDPDPPLRIRPSANQVEYLGDRKFKLLVDWDAEEPAPKDLRVFVHIFKPQVSRLVLTGFYAASGDPEVPTSRWQGRVTTGQKWISTIPEDCPPGEYEILVGLYGRGGRARLLGNEDQERRYRIGTLVVEGDTSQVTSVRLERNDSHSPLASRLQANSKPTDFGPVKTTGALRCEVRNGELLITPLPESSGFPLTVRLDRIFPDGVQVRTVQAVDADGTATRDTPFRVKDQLLSMTTAAGDFAYRVVLRIDERISLVEIPSTFPITHTVPPYDRTKRQPTQPLDAAHSSMAGPALSP